MTTSHSGRNERRLHPAWWTLILITLIVGVMVLAAALYSGAFISYVPITVTSERSGLVMEPGGKVMMRGIQVGQVDDVSADRQGASLHIQLFPDQIKYIPADVTARIRATTAFGAKYVDLEYPDNPIAARLAAGAVLRSQNVSTEVNTVFENLVGLLKQVDPYKVNAVLAALSEGFRGQGDRMGHAIADSNAVLGQLNSRSETIRRDWHGLQGFSETYGAAAQDIVSVLDAASTTSSTIATHAKALDTLLLNTIGFATAGTNLLAPNRHNLVDAINLLEPTTNLLMKYDPEYACTLIGAKFMLDHGGYQAIGGNGRTVVLDGSLHLGQDKYNYPDNLPIVAAKGGPGGKPGCGSLPDVAKMFPLRQLVTNTGWGTGLDLRPNPGVSAQTCFANFLPVTRAVPQPPDIRQCLPGPAVGPVTAPGMPPYGAALYGPGGVPLWPGIPPAGTPPPVPVPGTPVAPGKIPPHPAPPAVFGEDPALPTPRPPALPGSDVAVPTPATPHGQVPTP
jgi:phospholipid/cholesterol/gamma-HCH transport system substrate-binding protein